MKDFANASPVAKFDTVIRGVPHCEQWVSTDKGFLPIKVSDRQVLLPVWWDGAEEETDDEVAVGDEAANKEQGEAAKQEQGERVLVAPGLIVKDKTGRMGTIVDTIDSYSLRIRLTNSEIIIVGMMAQWKTGSGQMLKPVSTGQNAENEAHMRVFDTSGLEPGRGAIYEVVTDKAIIRASPSVDSRMENFKRRGMTVELFDWDSTRAWRRCYDDEIRIAGWMLLSHPQLGPLLWPKDIPMGPALIHPVYVAALENDPESLQKFCAEGLDVNDMFIDKEASKGSKTPLMCAAERAFCECCVYLLEAGADASLKVDLGGDVATYAASPAVTALILALSGQEFDLALFDEAFNELPEEVQKKADMLFEEAANFLAAHRKEDPRIPCVAVQVSDLARSRSARRMANLSEAVAKKRLQEACSLRQRQLQAELDEIHSKKEAAVAAEDYVAAHKLQVEAKKIKDEIDSNEAQARDPEKSIIGDDPDEVVPEIQGEEHQDSDTRPADQDCSIAKESAVEEECLKFEPGVSYEVVYDAVWIRTHPRPDSAQVGLRRKGDVVEMLETDDSGDWRRVRTGGKRASQEIFEPEGYGWMLLRHPRIGDLLRRTD